MSFLKSLLNKSKKFNDPFIHWELNQPLAEAAIQEISNADIENEENHRFSHAVRAQTGTQSCKTKENH